MKYRTSFENLPTFSKIPQRRRREADTERKVKFDRKEIRSAKRGV